jgi:hypothetical protein
MHAVENHHSFNFSAEEDPYQKRLTCVVGLANLFCHKIGAGLREPEVFSLHETAPAIHLNIEERHMDFLMENFIDAFHRDKDYFS